MLADWQSADGRKAIEKMGGWPRWDVPTARHLHPARLRLLHRPKGESGFRWTIETDQGRGDWTHCRATSPHEALCLLRDRGFGWLVEKNGKVEVSRFDSGATRIRIGTERHEHYDGTDYDKAMIQAILATERSET